MRDTAHRAAAHPALAGIATVIVSTLLASTAFAQSDQERAGEHFRRGSELYFEGKYAEAIGEFEKANALVPDALVLYNIVLANHKLGNTEAALAVARVAATMGGLGSKEQTSNEARIAAFQRTLGARAMADEVASWASKVAAVEAAEVGTETEAEPSIGTNWLRIASIGTLAAGGASLIGTIVVERVAAGTIARFEQAHADGDRDAFHTEEATLKSQQSLGRAFFYTGLGLVAIGGAMLVIDLSTDSAPGLAIGPGGVSWSVAF